MFIQRLRIVTFVGERFENGWVFVGEVGRERVLILKREWGFEGEIWERTVLYEIYD